MEISFGVEISGMALTFGLEMGGIALSFKVEMGGISGTKVSFDVNGTTIFWVLATPEIVDCSISFKPGSTSKEKMMK